MNFQTTWDQEKYQELNNYLKTKQDLKYQDFHGKIINSNNLIGIRTNELKKIAKEISKGDYQSFIKINNCNLYEFTMIEGFIYGYLKINIQDLITYLNNYLEKIDNWALVDLTVSNLKIFKQKENQEIGFKYAKKLCKNKNTWIKRFGIVLLLNYYLHDIYIDKTLELVSKIKTSDYYVQMAIAWLMSISYIKYKEKTLIYLVNIQDDFIYNKTISKIIDSRLINKDEKDFLKTLKRKTKKKKIKE